VAVSEATIIAIRIGNPVWVRTMLIVAAFTASQAAYTNYTALTMDATSLDKAFIPNLCYAVAVGIWLTFRFRDVPAVGPACTGKDLDGRKAQTAGAARARVPTGLPCTRGRSRASQPGCVQRRARCGALPR